MIILLKIVLLQIVTFVLIFIIFLNLFFLSLVLIPSLHSYYIFLLHNTLFFFDIIVSLLCWYSLSKISSSSLNYNLGLLNDICHLFLSEIAFFQLVTYKLLWYFSTPLLRRNFGLPLPWFPSGFALNISFVGLSSSIFNTYPAILSFSKKESIKSL